MAETDDQALKTTATELARKLKPAMERGTGTHLDADDVRFLGNSLLREWVERVCDGSAI